MRGVASGEWRPWHTYIYIYIYIMSGDRGTEQVVRALGCACVHACVTWHGVWGVAGVRRARAAARAAERAAAKRREHEEEKQALALQRQRQRHAEKDEGEEGEEVSAERQTPPMVSAR